MITINKSTKSPLKEHVLRRLHQWRDDYIIGGSFTFFTDEDWENDKYRDSVILNNINTLIWGYIDEHQEEKDFKQQFNKFILDLRDEIEKLFV